MTLLLPCLSVSSIKSMQGSKISLFQAQMTVVPLITTCIRVAVHC